MNQKNNVYIHIDNYTGETLYSVDLIDWYISKESAILRK